LYSDSSKRDIQQKIEVIGKIFSHYRNIVNIKSGEANPETG